MRQKGFTLIELMIVVAIVGILVAVAMVSVYMDYTIRSRVSEGLVMASSAKLAVSETTMVKNTLPANQNETGYNTPPATINVQSIDIGANGLITITYTQTAGGGTIILTPTLQANGDILWDCTGGNLLTKYRPTICRP
jgi:type IV pilus assembly protein PilA